MIRRERYAILLAIFVGYCVLSNVGRGQNKPLNESDIASLIELQIDSSAIIAKLQKGGVSFAVDEATISRLKTAGATDDIIIAIRGAVSHKPSAKVALVTYEDVLKLLSLGIDEATILKRLESSPTNFVLSIEKIAELRSAGASDSLIATLQAVRRISPESAELITDFAIVLDCSGSMNEITPEGETKMVVAKRVVSDLVAKIPEGMNVTLVIYGHEVFGGADNPRNCQAVKVARPISPLDSAGKVSLAAQINELRPTGATPIALSLKTAGVELAKNEAYCGLILITDGLETCKGDPVAEASALAANPKLTFGVNVIGFGIKPGEVAALAKIAESGKGKYYNADSAQELSDAMSALAIELDSKASKPEIVVSNRRAIRVPKPAIEFPEYAEIRVIKRGLGSVSEVAKGKYGDVIRIPSATEKYEIVWVPKTGEPVTMLADFMLSETTVVELKLEEHLGMIRVNGQGTPKQGIEVFQRGLGSTPVVQRCKKFGEIMVVPAGKVSIRVDGETIEEDLEIAPGKLHQLE